VHFPTLVRTRLEHVRNARRSPGEIKQLQIAKFRRLVRHAVTTSEYYRQVVADRRIDIAHCRPEEFPVMTKQILVENFDRIVTVPTITKSAVGAFLERSKDSFELFNGQYYVVMTSGTSGTRGYVAYSKRDWARGATQGLRINPPQLGKCRLAYFARTDGHHVGASFATSTQRWPLSMVYSASLFDLEEAIVAVTERLNRFRPTVLMGYPSAIAALAREQARGALDICPQWIQASGEPVTKTDREFIQSTFGVPLTNVYSCTEHMVMGFARPEFDGMYLLEDDLIFEINEDHVLVTNLFNHTTPLIRYRVNDMLTPRPDERRMFPFTKVAEIVGRGEVTATFTNRHGVDDIVSAIQVADLSADNVHAIQLRVADKTSCVVSVCLDRGLGERARTEALRAVEDGFAKLFAKKQMENVRLTIEEKADLPRDPGSGKVALVVHASS
jgi:phenylacetate-coenzyme A ligase PaaK-like adenylate-forming protein